MTTRPRFLIVSATDGELVPVRSTVAGLAEHLDFLVCGVGPAEAAIGLSLRLASSGEELPAAVINVGLAGGYPAGGVSLLDVCLAEKEFFGDLGICLAEGEETLDAAYAPPLEFSLDRALLEDATSLLDGADIDITRGNFVTVSCGSGTAARGQRLHNRFQAVCENMEGAALARVCERFSLPFLELRAVSNMVVDRDEQIWQAAAAAEVCAAAAQQLLEGLIGRRDER